MVDQRAATRGMMSLMTERRFEIVTLDGPDGRGHTRECVPQPVIERRSGERDAVLGWLHVRTEALRHAGREVRRLRYRQRRHVWAGKIAYHKAPILE